jgi:cobalt-zinc-cadmium efflux system protein
MSGASRDDLDGAHAHHHGHGHDHDHGHHHHPPSVPAGPPPDKHTSIASDHGHSHGHGHTEGREGKLTATLVLVLVWMVVEALGGWFSGSLALVADAGHMLSDAAALAITLFAVRMARWPASAQHTFGFQRAEILAAFLNASALLLLSLGILYEAWERLWLPTPLAGPMVVGVATVGLLVNLLSLKLLGHHHADDLNLRGAWLHVLSDALGSVGAILAGLAAWGLGWTWVDPAASALIALLVLRSGWQLLDESLAVLMERAPSRVDVGRLRARLLAQPGVEGVHDLHVWSLGAGQVAMSGHVVTTQQTPELLCALRELLRTEFGIGHVTLQLEPVPCSEPELHP